MTIIINVDNEIWFMVMIMKQRFSRHTGGEKVVLIKKKAHLIP